MKPGGRVSTISLVVAMGRNRAIGRDGGLPWHLPEDLRHFRALTLGKPVIMGRRTCESIGRPLPGRHNIVVTRSADYRPAGFTVCASLEEAYAACGDGDETAGEVMVIGGATIYEQALAHADRIHLTLIDRDFDGDTFFPNYDEQSWTVSARSDHRGADFDYSFLVLDRAAQDRG